MSHKVKILLVEDELIIAESLREVLYGLGYEVIGVEVRAENALETINREKPDLAILDIRLKGDKDGIWLAEQIKKNYEIPFIFLTSHGDEKTVQQAVKLNPYAYLLKPFEKTDIYTAVECALANFNERERPNIQEGEAEIFADFFFIKDDHTYVKVMFAELCFLKASGNYVELHTTAKRHLVRSTLKDITPKLPKKNFLQVHRSYTVNLEKVSGFGSSFVKVLEHELPLSNAYREELMKKFITH